MGDMITVSKCLQEKFDKRGLFRAGERIQEPGYKLGATARQIQNRIKLCGFV